MKIKTWIKYEESYLPPRCRKLRYRECEDYVDVELKEVSDKKLQLAFEDNSYGGKGKIYFYNGKLYSKVKLCKDGWHKDIEEREGISIKTALDSLIWRNEHCSTYFSFAFDRENYGKDTTREFTIEKAENDMAQYILVDGELYEESEEPRYVINTFGLGHNHGGTGMFCEYHYNPNIGKDNYFSALQGVEAVLHANEIASRRGDTKNVGSFKPFIICHMPELVKVNPNEHGNGNEFLNSCEAAICASNTALEAELSLMTLL